MRTLATRARAINQYNGLGNQLWDLAGNRPSLDLRFAEDKSLVDATTGTNLIDFTRASIGTYVGSDGLIKTATTNYLLQSEDFTTTWSSDGVCTVDPNQTLSPSGTLTADKITVDAGGPNRVSQTPTFQVSAGGTYILSAHIKTLDINRINIRLFLAGSDAYADYVFATNSFLVTNGAIITETGYTSLSDGWTRIFVKYQPTVSGSVNIRFGGGIGGSSVNGSFYLWGAQLEQSSTVGEYIPTTSTINSAPRFDHDPTTGESLGLLVEESRTNAITNNTMIGAAAGTPGVIPSGWSTASLGSLTRQIVGTGIEKGITYIDIKLSGTTSTTFTNIALDTIGVIEGADGETWAATSYVAIVAGSIANINSLRLRIGTYDASSAYLGELVLVPTDLLTTQGNVLTRSPATTGTVSNAATAYVNPYFQFTFNSGVAIDITLRIGLPQLEKGAFPTSVIATNDTNPLGVTRAADVASISGSNFSSWYRQSEGTVFTDTVNRETYPGVNVFPYIAQIDDGTNNNRISLDNSVLNGGYRYNLPCHSGGVSQGELNQFGFASGAARWASAFRTNDFALAINLSPSVVSTRTSGTLPNVMTRLRIGTGFGKQFSGTIRRLVYWRQRLPNETLQGITQQ